MSEIWTDVIFCDDIRQEASGKLIIIGFYPNDLVPPSIPTTFTMALCARVFGVSKGRHSFKVTALSPSGDMMFTRTGALDLKDKHSHMILVLSGFPMEITSTGEITALIEVDGKQLRSGKIRVEAPPTSGPVPETTS